MRVVIATFADPQAARVFRRALGEDFDIQGDAISVGTIAAWGEPYHDHPLVVAWVPRQLEGDVRALAGHIGGTVHEPSLNVVPPRSVALALAVRRQREADRAAGI